MSKRAIWHLAIALAGLLYIAVALTRNVESPVLAALFVLVAGYEVIESHLGKHKP